MDKLKPIIENITSIVNLIANHGIWKIFQSILLILIIIALLNPAATIQKVSEIIQSINREKVEFRQKNDPIIRNTLYDVVWKLGAVRVGVLEFHNGKQNPSGLGFYYADMNYEVVRNQDCYVSDQYCNVNLSLINLPDYLYKHGYWYGTVEELQELDPKLASMIQKNGTQWLAFLLLEGSDDLGILEVSFDHEPEDKQSIGRELRRVGTVVSSCLDFKNRDKHK